MSDIESVRSKTAEIRFEARRCIHSRNCVLGRPDVFVPNVEGEWLHPELASAEEVAELAHNCPSGAIQYSRLDGGPQEHAPKVNLMHVRENGPYAFHADLHIDGEEATFRATLCRCGASKSKPYCDNSHIAEGFRATGEPESADTPALAVRDGAVAIKPALNGPLLVNGSLEIVSGTGRTLAKTTRTALCRCGHSGNKPFCDGTHAKIGFVSM